MSAASSGALSIVVADATGFAANKKILIAQMTNASGNGYSEILDSYGGQEENEIEDMSGNTLTLKNPLFRNYPATYTQVILIRQYNNLTITNNTTLTAPTFDGTKGGIIYFKVAGTLQIDAGSKIDVTGKGYGAGSGPGKGGNTGTFVGGGGGGYGGKGGLGGGSAPKGEIYGTAAGVEYMGSGGGGMYSESIGGAGGGRVKIIANNITVTGSIRADGKGGGFSGSYVGGGGSGGGIYIKGTNINVSGGLSAAGGGGAGYNVSTGSGVLGEDGGASQTGKGGNGGTGTSSGGSGGLPGIGGNGGDGNYGAAGSNGGSSAGGGGGTGPPGFGYSSLSGGGGGAGRIAVYYGSFNGGTAGKAIASGVPDANGRGYRVFYKESTSEASATFTFTTTSGSIDLRSTKGPNRSQEKIYIDGVFQTTIDLYAASYSYNNSVYTKTGLSPGTHTIKVEAIDNGEYGEIDAFVVDGTTTYQESDPNIIYKGYGNSGTKYDGDMVTSGTWANWYGSGPSNNDASRRIVEKAPWFKYP